MALYRFTIDVNMDTTRAKAQQVQNAFARALNDSYVYDYEVDTKMTIAFTKLERVKESVLVPSPANVPALDSRT